MVCFLAVGLPVLLINGWWFVRNLMLYGELTGTRRMALIAGLRDQPLSVEQWGREIVSVWATYWGIRAEALPVWARVAVPVAMLALLGLGAYVALRRPGVADLRGAGSFSWGERERRIDLSLHFVWAASLFGLLLVWTAQTPASYGRLLYPGIVAFTLLLVAGLAWLLPPALFRGLALIVPLGLLVWAGLFPSRVLAHEFRDLRWPAPAQVVERPLETPPGALPISRQPRQRYGDRIVLDEVRLNAGWYTPEEPVGLTLGWRGLAGASTLEGLVYLLCPGNQVVGLARVPLDVPPGARAESRLAVPTAIPTEPSLCQVVIGVDDPVTGPLPVLDESGRPISAKQPTAEFRLAPLRRPVPSLVTEGATDFGGVFRLLGAQPVDPLLRPGETSSLFLFWESLAPVDEFWTVFVHLLGPDGRIVAQDDRPPAGGGAPTWTWRTGAIVADRHQLKIPESLPPGEYRLIVGFYRSDPPGRLPTADGSDHSVVLTERAPGGGG